MTTEAQNQVDEQTATEATAPAEQAAQDTVEGNAQESVDSTNTEASSTEEGAGASTAEENKTTNGARLGRIELEERTISGGEAA